MFALVMWCHLCDVAMPFSVVPHEVDLTQNFIEYGQACSVKKNNGVLFTSSCCFCL